MIYGRIKMTIIFTQVKSHSFDRETLETLPHGAKKENFLHILTVPSYVYETLKLILQHAALFQT